MSRTFSPTIFSRHPSHSILRSRANRMPKFTFRTTVRLGSTTESNNPVQINSVQSIRTSSNKLRMKESFVRAGVRTAEYVSGILNQESLLREIARLSDNYRYRIVAKAHFGSRGNGNTLISSESELLDWTRGKTLQNYIFERFHNYGLEYRLHVTSEGCFYTCRKALRQDTPEELRWRHHDDTCVWLLETNENFRKPNSWDDIVAHCVSALEEVGADILSFDVKVQTERNPDGSLRPYQDYILLECNSASSMGAVEGNDVSICAEQYIKELPKIIVRKAIDLNLF